MVIPSSSSSRRTTRLYVLMPSPPNRRHPHRTREPEAADGEDTDSSTIDVDADDPFDRDFGYVPDVALAQRAASQASLASQTSVDYSAGSFDDLIAHFPLDQLGAPAPARAVPPPRTPQLNGAQPATAHRVQARDAQEVGQKKESAGPAYHRQNGRQYTPQEFRTGPALPPPPAAAVLAEPDSLASLPPTNTSSTSTVSAPSSHSLFDLTRPPLTGAGDSRTTVASTSQDSAGAAAKRKRKARDNDDDDDPRPAPQRVRALDAPPTAAAKRKRKARGDNDDDDYDPRPAPQRARALDAPPTSAGSTRSTTAAATGAHAPAAPRTPKFKPARSPRSALSGASPRSPTRPAAAPASPARADARTAPARPLAHANGRTPAPAPAVRAHHSLPSAKHTASAQQQQMTPQASAPVRAHRSLPSNGRAGPSSARAGPSSAQAGPSNAQAGPSNAQAAPSRAAPAETPTMSKEACRARLLDCERYLQGPRDNAPGETPVNPITVLDDDDEGVSPVPAGPAGKAAGKGKGKERERELDTSGPALEAAAVIPLHNTAHVAQKLEAAALGKRSARADSLAARPAVRGWVEAETPSPPPVGRMPLDEPSVFNPPKPAFVVSSSSALAPPVADPNEPIFIAHDENWARIFARSGVPWGAQWTFARLVSAGVLSFADVRRQELAPLLHASNAAGVPEAVRLARAWYTAAAGADGQEPAPRGLLSKDEMAATSPWRELDKEEAALRDDAYAGLGCNAAQPGWYGGKVHFVATLKAVDGAGARRWRVELAPPELGTSCRFARRWGSWRFVRVRVPRHIWHHHHERAGAAGSSSSSSGSAGGLIGFFAAPLVVLGRVFRAVWAKEGSNGGSVFLAQTDEVVRDGRVWAAQAPGALSLWSLLNWHNPLDDNRRQTLAKWVSRLALGFSNSVPGVKVDWADIEEIPDVLSDTGSDMTDGCGWTNVPVLYDLFNQLDWPSMPTTIQCRIAGAKGLLLRHPEPEHQQRDGRPRVWLRPSQIKIRYSGAPDPAQRIIDVLRASHMRSPARISPETIINFAENGVPARVFEGLLHAGLRAHVARFLAWDGAAAMCELWCTVADAGAVTAQRRARENAGEARARGYAELDPEDNEEDEDEDEVEAERFLRERSTAWWADETSGCPSSLEETVLVMLDAGFTPDSCAVLREKLKEVIKRAINRYVLRKKIDVIMSCTAFIVPDPYGVLAEDEIQVRSSHEDLISSENLPTDIILGPVLLTRNPCKLPSDTRKLKAVERLELRQYKDVIVLSVQGHRRVADLLAGGDYDGDKGLVIWDPTVVEPFVNASLKFADEPASVQSSFHSDNKKVGEFLDESEGLPTEKRADLLRPYLLAAVNDPSLVAKYSTYHEKAVYMNGYDHPDSIRLAYMFCKVLDRQKTGLILKSEVAAQDKRFDHSGRDLEWKRAFKIKGDAVVTNESNHVPLRRPPALGDFIMDVLDRAAQRAQAQQMANIDETFGRMARVGPDASLFQPWKKAWARAQREKEEEKVDRRERDLKAIKKHVEGVYRTHTEKVKRANRSPKKERAGATFTEKSIIERQNDLREVSLLFASSPSEVLMDDFEVDLVKASYAYFYDSQASGSRGWSRFPFDVAMRDLCLIKAKSCGPWKAVTDRFYSQFSIRSLPRIRRMQNLRTLS